MRVRVRVRVRARVRVRVGVSLLGDGRRGRRVGHVLALRLAERGRVGVVQRARVAEPLHVEGLEGVEAHLVPVAARVLEHAHDLG